MAVRFSAKRIVERALEGTDKSDLIDSIKRMAELHNARGAYPDYTISDSDDAKEFTDEVNKLVGSFGKVRSGTKDDVTSVHIEVV